MDATEFARIDQMLFERVHRGPPTPIVVQLKEGGQVVGELQTIRRSGAVGSSDAAPTGELYLVAASGPIAVQYDQIADIS